MMVLFYFVRPEESRERKTAGEVKCELCRTAVSRVSWAQHKEDCVARHRSLLARRARIPLSCPHCHVNLKQWNVLQSSFICSRNTDIPS